MSGHCLGPATSLPRRARDDMSRADLTQSASAKASVRVESACKGIGRIRLGGPLIMPGVNVADRPTSCRNWSLHGGAHCADRGSGGSLHKGSVPRPGTAQGDTEPITLDALVFRKCTFFRRHSAVSQSLASWCEGCASLPAFETSARSSIA